jgi:YesN/AraC family two-component response regulator
MKISLQQPGDNGSAQANPLFLLKVSDTGIGIAPEYREKIFERFFRITDANQNQPAGTGIGLHLASEFAKLHGGSISVESQEERGSVFTLAIELHTPLPALQEKESVIHPGKPASEMENTETQVPVTNSDLPVLLLVDDNRDMCHFLSELFADRYHIYTAHDGEEAYSAVCEQLPDIILCDVMMPKMDGYDLCRKIKNDIRFSHIPLILLTAKTSEQSAYEGIEAGADDYIAKPFNIEMLSLKLAKIVEKQKTLQNAFRKKVDIIPADVEIESMDRKFVRKAVETVEQNIDNPNFGVEELALQMAMSRVYFYKKISALTGKRPLEFIRFIRLKRAAQLLERSQMFVNEVAYKVGFNDPKYFRKYFKEEFGCTPNEYKQKKEKDES